MKDYSFSKAFRLVSAVLAIPLLVACTGEASSTSTSSDSSESTSFPSSLAVASPFDTTDADSAVSSSLSGLSAASSSATVTYYTWATGRIDQILNGTASGGCTFDPELFLTQTTDAGCYGPSLNYEDHPDGSPGTGQLPSGDVGLWAETDDDTGHACAAAQLNAQMEGVRDRSLSSLMGLASLVCTAQANGLSNPSNSTLDLTAEMTDLGLTGVTFNSASITHSDASGDDIYSYDLDFVYDDGVNTYDIVVDMEHTPSSTTAGAYEGRLSYMVNDSLSGGNCDNALGSTDVTTNGSFVYNRSSSTAIDVEVREAQFCGHDSDGLDADGIVDASDKFDSTTNTDGWGENFSIFAASYSPEDLTGDYTYSWQAGPDDGAARVFNVAVSSSTEADAFFGYGDDIQTTDGNITGFICNWAGPNADHTQLDYVQSQSISYDSTSELFVADSSDIGYAPTNGCDYDGTGSFTFDSDFDMTVDTDPAVVIANDLLPVTDADADNIFDEIQATGFVAP